MINANQFYIFKQLVFKDLILFFRSFKDKFIDLTIMLALNVIVFGYFMPGLPATYGTFILVGAIASFGFFEVVGKVGLLITDLEGDRTINYKLILPIKPWLVLCSQAVAWAIEAAIVNILLFPLGKLLLFSRFDLSQICLYKLLPIILVSNLFFGFFALWTTSMLKGGVRGLQHLWIRFISPIYFFGCYFYTWKSAYSMSPIIGYLSLLNPMVHAMEGARSAVLGTNDYLPFYFTLLSLMGFTVLFAWDSIRRLKIKLDCM